jgi:hypothetical protein
LAVLGLNSELLDCYAGALPLATHLQTFKLFLYKFILQKLLFKVQYDYESVRKEEGMEGKGRKL